VRVCLHPAPLLYTRAYESKNAIIYSSPDPDPGSLGGVWENCLHPNGPQPDPLSSIDTAPFTTFPAPAPCENTPNPAILRLPIPPPLSSNHRQSPFLL
jgi:hypothetical protein